MGFRRWKHINAINPTHLYPVAGTYTITLIANDTSTCNKTDTTRQTITVANPQRRILLSHQYTDREHADFIHKSVSPDAVNFVWNFGDGATLQTLTRLAVTHQYNVTGTYNVCLVAINGAGCPDTTCQQINALVTDAVDVPNAFTPLSSDINNTVFVRGSELPNCNLLFGTAGDKKCLKQTMSTSGGMENSKAWCSQWMCMQYTLSVEFSDGKKATKKVI
jgi:PKD repeat protein